MEGGVSESSSNQTNTNTPLVLNCGRNPAMSSTSFFSNLNATLSQLRGQLSTNGVYFGRAQTLRNEDSVYGLAQCRDYLSTSQCLDCFDAAVSAVNNCSAVNGANVFFDNCFLRYENFDEFYSNPQTTMDVGASPTGLCGNQSASQPITTFNQTVDDLLSDIQVATPRTSDFYVALTRQVPSSNKTVYGIGQCVENTSQDICQNCMNTAYGNLQSCLPNSEGRTIDLGCFMRYSETPFFQGNQTTNIASLLTEGSSSKTGVIVGVGCGVGLLLLILFFLLWYRRWKKSKSTEEDTAELQGAKHYNYQDLLLATGHFSEEYRIGKGGFGEVFKAVVDNGNVVAVKKLNVEHGRGELEFNNEVNLLTNIRHRNLLRLLGWSSRGSELLLVLEYMPQGSLDKFLWGARRGSLNWNQRREVIFGIARGLAHLHEEFHVKIIHRDIKSNNILLDNDFQAKIADFGLARFQPEDQTHVITGFAGTLGYTAPEYATRGHLTEKVDTYSFGIVALEIITGRRCTDMHFDGPDTDYLLEHAWQLYEKDMHADLIDEAIDPSEYENEDVMKIIEIALMCTQSTVTSRPTMSEVVLMLSSGRSLGRRKLTKPTLIDPARRIYIGASANKK